jgi:hypothetical protein
MSPPMSKNKRKIKELSDFFFDFSLFTFGSAAFLLFYFENTKKMGVFLLFQTSNTVPMDE